MAAGVSANDTAVSAPERIQQRRTKGWRKPVGAVGVGRGTRWGNPYRVVQDAKGRWNLEGPGVRGAHWKNIGEELAVSYAVAKFAAALAQGTLDFTIDDVAQDLGGKTLMCWCTVHTSDGHLAPCHGQVLLEVANDPDGFRARRPLRPPTPPRRRSHAPDFLYLPPSF